LYAGLGVCLSFVLFSLILDVAIMVHWTSFLPLVGSAFFAVAAAAEVSAQIVPGAYIVELADNEVRVHARLHQLRHLTMTGLGVVLQQPRER
jgi:hypothetical protein